MKNFLLILCFLGVGAIYSQTPNQNLIEETEKEISAYISQHLATFNIPTEEIKQIKKNIVEENKEMEEDGLETITQNAIEYYKKHLLRVQYFKENPEKRKNYKNQASQRVLQVCSNGGFESGLGQYTFTQSILPYFSNTGSVNINTGSSNFVPLAPSALNNSVGYATPVSPGTDPSVAVSRVLNGNRAIRLNNMSTTSRQIHITTMSRNFVVNENYFNFNYSLIFENPGHTPQEQPFFVVRIYDQNDNILRQVSAFSDPDDCVFNSLNPSGDDTRLYTGWVCDRIDVSDFMGQNVRVEFIIADCSRGSHWGKVYIDDICGSNCANPLNGTINLNSIPTIDCPTEDITICGTYTLPQQSSYDNISLSITQNGNLISAISAPTTRLPNSSGGTFCFNVPLSAFGYNPNGNFEFEVQGNFTRTCPGIGNNFALDPIFDYSANDSGPDVVFADCITANDDTKIFSNCSSHTFSLLENDTVYGNPATPNNTTILLPLFTLLPQGISVNTSTGIVRVSSSLSPGTYSFNYNLYNANNFWHLDTGTVTIEILPPEITANNDDFSDSPINSCEGGTMTGIKQNDTYCGNPIVLYLKYPYSFSIINDGGLSGVSMNTRDGTLSVPPATPGTYTVTYEICNTMTNVCDTAEITIVVNYGITPEFSFLTEICKDSSPPQLPLTSNNNVSGTWSPSMVNNQTSGSYTFTPDENCAETISVDITVIEECGLFFQWEGEVGCEEGNFEPINFDYEDIEDASCLRVCEESLITYMIAGNAESIASVEWVVSGGTVNLVTDNGTTAEIEWGTNSSGYIKINVILHNGSVTTIERCIEIIEKPTAYFEVFPFPKEEEEEEIIVCAETPIIFDNLSFDNGGNGSLYYNWDFDNGDTSNEFEPTYTYTNPGTYNVILQVFNACSCIGTYTRKIIINEPFPPISCPGVVCEGALSTYSLPHIDCHLSWQVIGGEIAWQNENSVSVHWNQVGEDGMGYINVASEECLNCTTSAKVPVVQSEGTIQGPKTVCAGAQRLFSLPQWPTTDYNWSLQANGTGASLRVTNQRNEIIVQTNNSGTITLVCHYENTLLGCGGRAEFDIEVMPRISLTDIPELCENDSTPLEFVDETGNSVNTIEWRMSGPEDFSQAGHTAPVDMYFPYAGFYNIEIVSPQYCQYEMTIQVEEGPKIPNTINGPSVICPGVPETFSVEVPPGNTAHWEVTNGEILGAPVGSEISVNFDPALSFEVEVWFDNDTDCPSEAMNIQVEPETIDLTFTQQASQVCGSTYQLYEVAGNNAETYNWEIIPSSAGSIETGQNTNQVYILWNQASLSNVEVKVNARKCQLTFENSTFVDIIPSPPISIGGDTEACTGQPASFHVNLPTGAGFTDITWDFGDGTTAGAITNSTQITHEYKAPLTANTNYTVTATVTGVNGCTMASTASYLVTVSPSPVVTISTLRVSACDNNNSNTIIAINQQGGFASTDMIEWYKNGSLVSSVTNNTSIDVVNSPGTYYAEVTNTHGCTASTRAIEAKDCGGGGPSTCNDPALDDFAYTATITDCGEVTLDVTDFGVNYSNAIFTDYPSAASLISSSYNQLIVGDLLPGSYSADLLVTFTNHHGDQVDCSQDLDFIIPYAAGLKYNILCAGNGQYEVNLLDYSEYYPGEQPTQFEFTTDGGTSWQSGTTVNGIAQLNTQLPPGTYQTGIRILGNATPNNPVPSYCEAYETITLPALPDASFSFDAGCENEAVRFDALANDPDLFYEWEFGDATNLQQDPVKSFNSGDFNQVTLTVTNKYGCYSSSSQLVNVTQVNMGGFFQKSPATACEGETITLSFNNTSFGVPDSFEWYKDEKTLTPYAITTSPTLNVTENGQYFAYITDSNGCKVYDIPAASVGFITPPNPPKISGTAVVCEGSSIQVEVPENDYISYTWYRDGQVQTAWDDRVNITDVQPIGTYTYSVEATLTGNGVSCTGPAGSFTVNVMTPPANPEIGINILSCSPYQVEAFVTNPQQGVAYYWSNGGTGSQTLFTHDGPVRVRAEVNNCSVSAQTDLPTDLETLAWIFPTGCYTSCYGDFSEGYLIGPLGGFDNWEWRMEQQTVQQGGGPVLPLDSQNIYTGSSYSLVLEDGCLLEIGSMHMDHGECRNCDIRINNSQAHCININGEWVYEIVMDFTNNYGLPVGIDLFAISNQGYFTTNTALLPPGNSNQVFYFYPQNGFTGGQLNISFTGMGPEGIDCHEEISLNLSQCPPPPSPRPAPIPYFSLQVVPNPVTSYTTAYYEVEGKAQDYRVVLTDLNGKHISGKQLTELKGNLIFDCSGLASGTYHLSLQKHERSMKTVKLIVE